MKYFLSIIAIVFSFNLRAQLTIIDTPHCLDHTLHAEIVGGVIPTSAGITSDDGWSGVFPIGFTYNFYGTPNTQCIIGSNGCLGFNLGSAGAYNTWPISASLAATTSTDIRNVILGPWCDVFIPAGGVINYSQQGVAPNRNFAVTWCGTRMYSCTTEWLTTQIIIYETTGLAEVHIQHRTICSTGWNGQKAIVGVKNASGTTSTAAPGRDFPAIWTVPVPEAWRFTPIAGPSYSVSSIPYNPIPYASSAIYWYDSATHAYLGSGPDIHVAPTVGTTYVAAALGCNDTTKAYIHVLPSSVVFGGLPHINSFAKVDPSVCGKCDGKIAIKIINPHTVDSILWSFNGVPQATYIDSAGNDSIITLSNLCAGTVDYIYYKIGNCPSNQVGPITLAPPPLHMDLAYSVDFDCTQDVVSFWNMSTPTGTEYVNTWDYGDGTLPLGTTLNPVHIYTAQGTYTISLHYATVYATASTCFADTSFTIPILHPIDAHLTVDANAVCLGTPLHFTGSTISNNEPKYNWNFGDGVVIYDTLAADHKYLKAGRFTTVLTVQDTIGCIAQAYDTFEVISVSIKTRVHDTSVCLVDSMKMVSFVTVLPDSIDYSITWSPTNNIGATTGLETRFFGIGNYTYTATLATPPMILDPNGCVATDTQRVNSYPPVVLTNLTTSPITVPYGSSIQLNANGAVYYTWTPPDGSLTNNNINNPVASPRDPQTIYTVYGMNLYGCIDSAQIVVNVDNNLPDGVPSAFTPNGDGNNDVFKVAGITFQKMVDFRVFNRWGQEVFHTANPEIGWDGTYHGVPQDIGVYNWTIIVSHPNDGNKVFKGNVTLIR